MSSVEQDLGSQQTECSTKGPLLPFIVKILKECTDYLLKQPIELLLDFTLNRRDQPQVNKIQLIFRSALI